ncbi:MAG: hypothetical protein GY851_15650, partial [bacterium]|nr:hypothetical protein [bacterium]
ALKTIDQSLEERKDQHPQLSELNGDQLVMDPLPQNPHDWWLGMGEIQFDYDHGYAWEGRSLKPNADDWCAVHVWARQELFVRSRWVENRITYRKQGISLCWSVWSGDEGFNKGINELIRASLDPIADFERELGAEPLDTMPDHSGLWAYR